MCGPRAPWTPAQRGLSHATPLGGCYVSGHDPSPPHAGGRVTPERGFPRQAAEASTSAAARTVVTAPAPVTDPLSGSAPSSAITKYEVAR